MGVLATAEVLGNRHTTKVVVWHPRRWGFFDTAEVVFLLHWPMFLVGGWGPSSTGALGGAPWDPPDRSLLGNFGEGLGLFRDGLVAQILGIGLRAPQIFERKHKKKIEVCDLDFFLGSNLRRGGA